MPPESSAAPESYDRELVLTRTFDAPRALVWRAWTDPKQLAQWWGPANFTNPVCQVDLRPGGTIYVEMRAPDGASHPMRGEFREIVEPERIVFLSGALDPNGKPMFEVLTTVTFTADGDKTRLTMRAEVVTTTPAAPQYLKGMRAGWTQSLERLAAYLAK